MPIPVQDLTHFDLFPFSKLRSTCFPSKTFMQAKMLIRALDLQLIVVSDKNELLSCPQLAWADLQSISSYWGRSYKNKKPACNNMQ